MLVDNAHANWFVTWCYKGDGQIRSQTSQTPESSRQIVGINVGSDLVSRSYDLLTMRSCEEVLHVI